MKILLTGSNGFVGSHIAEELSAQGHQVRCLVRSTSNRDWLKDTLVEYCTGDICEIQTLKNALRDIDAVVHCAGVVRALRPETYYKVNQNATGELARTILNICPGLKKFVYISSQAAMGPSSGPFPKPLGEKENPVTDYGLSKLGGERELAILTDKVPYTIFRPAAVYGPRDKDLLLFFRLVHWGIRPRPLASRLFQLVYVKDVAKAVSSAVTSGKASGRTYFLGHETPYSWETAAQTIAEAAGKRTFPLPLPDFVLRAVSYAAEAAAHLLKKPAVLNRQKIDELFQPYWLGDPSPTVQDLGIDFTNLKIGATMTYLWYQENGWL